MLETLTIIAVGGGIGACLRYITTMWAIQRWGMEFPYGTLIVNVIGCFCIGVVMMMFMERSQWDERWRLLITTGFLGGLTTFSSFGYESITLLSNGNAMGCMYNILANVILGLGATWLGMLVAKAM